MHNYKKARVTLMLIGIVSLVVASGVIAMLAHATATPAASTAATSTSPEPTNQDNSHDLIYSTYGYYYLFYVDNYYVYYVSSSNTNTWSSPVSLGLGDGVNEGQVFSTYYNTATNKIYLVVAGGGVTTFLVWSAVPSSTGTLGSSTSTTYSDGLGYSIQQPSITFDSAGNTIIAYEGIHSRVSANVVVDRIAPGNPTPTILLNWSSGQRSDDWDGKVYPYGSGGAFVLMYSSLHTGGAASIYIQDYTGSAWDAPITTTINTEVTHGNGFTKGNTLYYVGQADGGYYGVFFTHTLGVTTPPTYTTIFPTSLGIDDGYGSMSWDGANTMVAYYDSGVESPYTVWVSVSTNLGSSWTTPAVLATSSAEFAPETLGTNLVINSGVSDVYWAVQSSSGSSIQVDTFAITAFSPPLTAPTISVTPTTIDSGQSAMLSTTTSFSGGASPYTCQWLVEAPVSSYVNLGTSFSCNIGDTPSASTGALSTGTWSFEFQVTDSSGTPVTVTSGAVTVTVNLALSAGAITPSSPAIDSGQSVTLIAAASGGTTPYSYQWYSDSSATCSSDTTALGTASTQSVSPTSSTYYCYRVTDASTGTPAASATSSTDLVTVNSALVAGAITPSSPTIDSGQPVTLTANPSGGTNPYHYQWYTGASCTTLITGQTGATYVASPTSTTTYYYKVTDSAYSPASQCSSGDTVTVGSGPSVSVSPVTIDSAQKATLTAVASGGSGSYTYAWYQGASCSGSVLGTSASYTTAALTSTTEYCVQVTDSLGGTASTTVTVTVNSALVADAITPSAPSIDSGQTTTLTSHESGGSSTFSYQWYTSSDCSTSPIGGATSSTYAASPTTTTTYFYKVTDSSSIPESACSAGDTVMVNSAIGTPTVVPSLTVIDSGQSISVQVAWSGGTSTYSIHLYSSSTSTCTTGSASVGTQTGQASSPYSFIGLSPTVNTWYCATVTDSAVTPVTSSVSSSVEVTVNGPLTAGAITPSAPTIDSGQSVTLTVNPSGGIAPYTYQWYSGSSSTCSSDTTALGTASTQSVSPTSSTYYCYSVTDSAGDPSTATSAADQVTVDAVLAASAITPQSPALDSGQSVTLTSHASGGTGSYTYQWYSGTSATCSSDATALGTASTQSVSPSTNTYYCYKVTDASVGTPNGVSSSTDLVAVNPALTTPSISTTTPTINSGQTASFSVSWTSSGTSPYTVTLYYSPSSSSCTTLGSQIDQKTGQPGSPVSFSESGLAIGTDYVCATLKDSATSPQTTTTSTPVAVTVTVNVALSAGAITPSSPTIDSGQSIILTAHASGGTSPYSYKWYSGSSATCSSDTTLLGSTTSTQSVNPTVNTFYCYSVTDSASSPSSQSSATDLVTVHSALTAGAITPSAPTIVIGKSTTLTAHASGGTSPYSYQWYSGSSAACSSDTTALGTASTQSVSPTANTYYCYGLTDSSTGTPVAGMNSATDQVTVNKATTATNLTCTSPVAVGTPATCTVTVTGAYGSTNGETVSFTASGSGTFSSGATCALSGGTCSLTYTPTSVSGSPQTITATYSGDTNNAGSSGTASVMVNPKTQKLSLDSSASNGCDGCTSQSITLGVNQNDLVVVFVALSPQSVAAFTNGYFPVSGGRSVLTSISSSGLSFTNRLTQTDDYGDATWVWTYWAVAQSTGSASILFTVNASAAWTTIGYSISGANTANPFDANPSLPATDFNDCNSVDGCSVAYSTSNPNDMVLAMIGSQGNPTAKAPPGFTLIGHHIANGWMMAAAAYQVVSSAQTSVSTGNWVLSTGESAFWFADAVVAASSSSSSSSSTSTSSAIPATSTSTSTWVTSSTSSTSSPSLMYTPTSVSGSPQTIAATYSGDTNNAGSSGKASIRVT